MGWVTIPKQQWFELGREFSLRRDATLMRGPIEWSWDVTNRCLGHCLHCLNRSGVLPREELSDAEMLDISQQIAAQKPLALCLCGGEPLLRLEPLIGVAEILTTAKIAVSMVTNGFLVTEEVAARLQSAGVRLVQVSVDGATAATHERLRRLPGSFDRAWHAIELLHAAGLTVGVSFAPTRFNIEEWRQVYDRCREQGVCDMRLQPLMPLGQCHVSYDEIAPTQEQYRRLIEEVQAVAWADPTGMRLEWGDPVDHLIRFGQFFTMVSHMLHVTSEGSLLLSVYLPILLGNLRRHSIEDYWQAGLGSAWQLRLVREMAYRVRSNRDFAAIRPHPFFDAPIDLDLIDHTREEIDHLSDTVLEFMDRVWPAPGRPVGPGLRKAPTGPRPDPGSGLEATS